MKLTHIFIIAMVLIASCSSPETTTTNLPVQDPYHFGVVLPLTGPAAFYGAFTKAGIDLAIEDINAQGGINGRSVQVVYEDGPDKAAATTAAQKLVNIDGVDAIFSVTTAMSGVTGPIAENAKIPMIYGAATNSFTLNKTFVFKDYPGAEDSCELLMAKALKDGRQRIAHFGTNAEYSLLCREGIKRVGSLVASELYNPGETDFRTQFTKIKDSNADAILLSAIAQDCPHAFKQIREIGLGVPVYIMFQSVGCGSPDNTAKNPDVLQGAFGSDVALDEESTDKGFLDFRKRLEQNGPITQIKGSAIMYDSVMTMAKAFDGCSDSICVTDNLRSLKGYKGVSGIISYNGKQTVDRQIMVTKYEDGKWKKTD